MNQINATRKPWNERATEALLTFKMDRATKGSCIIILVMFFFSVITTIYNKTHANYPGGIDLDLIRDFFGVWIIYRLSSLIPFTIIRQICSALCFTLFCIVASFIAAGGIATTPSLHILNWSLLAIDLKLGFHQIAVMSWTQQHPWLVETLQFAYNSWGVQFLVVPVGLALFNREAEVAKWTYATLMSMVIGGMIYFVFPSTSPASVLDSPYFPASCYACIAHYYGLHHLLDIPSNGCGLIDFPSFHVIDAVLNFLAVRRIKVLAIPLLILNSILIASTLLLGYHFLVDVIAGFIIAFFTYYMAQSLTK
jgi:membrane-associated phospholipid phosphatase